MQACAIMFGVKVLLIWLSAAEELDMENEFLLPPVFGEEYEEFVSSLTKNLNKELWTTVSFIHDEEVVTDNFFEVYDSYFEEYQMK